MIKLEELHPSPGVFELCTYLLGAKLSQQIPPTFEIYVLARETVPSELASSLLCNGILLVGAEALPEINRADAAAHLIAKNMIFPR